MRVAREWPAIEAKTQNSADLSVNGALTLLADTTKAEKETAKNNNVTKNNVPTINTVIVEPAHHREHHDDVDRERGVQIQVFACLLDAWDEATLETRKKFLTTPYVHDGIMDVATGRAAA